MLALGALSPVTSPLPLRVWKPVATSPAQFPEIAVTVGPAGVNVAPAARAPSFRLTWEDAVLGAYVLVAGMLLARLAVGYLFTRRLMRAATPIPAQEDLYTSRWISVPLTIGRKVVLPVDWETWARPKLEAVLAHERTHVRRADWAIALMAGVNRCVFWFHPLTWSLERRLAVLAGGAGGDSALLLVESQSYAEALLDMAAAVRSRQGRLVWEAMAMAKAAEVRKRIELILDETREIPRDVTPRRWAALLACSLPLVWLVSVAQPAPAVAQDAPKTPAAMSEFLKGRRQLSPGDVTV